MKNNKGLLHIAVLLSGDIASSEDAYRQMVWPAMWSLQQILRLTSTEHLWNAEEPIWDLLDALGGVSLRDLCLRTW